MVAREANFEGQTAGTTVGVANSAAFGDDPFTLVSINAMTLQYGNVFMHGAGGVTVGTGAATQYAFMRYGGFSNAKCVTRFYIRLRAYPTNEFQVLHFQSSASVSLSGFNITPTGVVKVVGPNQTLLYTSTATMALNTWYRMEFATTISGTAGQIKFSGFTGDSATAIGGMNYDSGTAFNSGTTLIAWADVGKITPSAPTGAFDLDDFAVNDGSSTFLGPFASVAPIPRAVVNTGSAVIDCTATTAGQAGDTLTYSISPSANTSQPARGIFLVPQATAATTYTITVVESNGQSKTTSAIVPAAAQTTPTETLPKSYHNGQWV
jgi:hypothetical protein